MDAAPLDPSTLDTLPCSLPREYSPGVQPDPPHEEPSSSSARPSTDAMPLSLIDQRIRELEHLATRALGPLGVVRGQGSQKVGKSHTHN